MSSLIRILIAEHNSSDMDLIENELKKGGINFISQLAQNETRYIAALKTFVPDIILCDYTFPSFDGPTAFKLSETLLPGTPFIIVSGTIGEEKSVELIKEGVTDYVLKDKLFTLTPKIIRALADETKRKETARMRELLEFDKNNLDALINNTKDLMWSIDRNFNLITSNKPFEEMSRVNFGRLILKGESVLSVSDTPEMEDRFKKLYERAFAGEIFTEISHFDIPFEFWSEISYYPIYQGSEVIGTACHSRDITEAKLAERQLQKSEAFTSGVLNALSSHIAVVDASGTIIAVNESWKRFAFENGETSLLSCGQGANYYKVCESSAGSDFGEASLVLQGIKDVMNGTKSTFYLEYPCHSPEEKRWFGVRALKFESDEPMVVVAHQNISERKLAEENLTQSLLRLNEAQKISHLGNWEFDFAKNVHTWSDELYNILGIQKEERAKPSTELFLSFMHPEDADEIKIKVNEAFKSLKASSYNFRFIKPDGTIRYGYTERKFEFDENNKPSRLLGVVQDITERKLIEEEREKMISNIVQHSKNLEQFAFIVSHNLRAPVANILGLSNVLKNTISKEDRLRSEQFLFKATEQLDNVLKDLNKILEVRSEINEYKEIVSLNELVTLIKSSINGLIEKEMVQIITNFAATDKIVSIKSYIYSVFYNLISNSIKYRQADKSPVIKIKSEVENGKIKICFTDNGLGIDLIKYGDKVFGLYKRFNMSKDGKGLGLFMVKTQVEGLGGIISVKSKPNEGCEFIIELPLE